MGKYIPESSWFLPIKIEIWPIAIIALVQLLLSQD